MWWYEILGVLLLVNKLVKAENYSISNCTTNWINATCSMAEPWLTYKNTFFEVSKSIAGLPTNSDVWIGYVSVKVPYLFKGCKEVQSNIMYNVTSIGYCQSVCSDDRTFGVQAQDGVDILNPSATMNCVCLNESVDGTQCEGSSNNTCSDNCFSIFTQIIDPNTSSVINHNDTEHTGDCLLYYPPGFEWKPCRRSDPIKVMCSNSTYTDSSARATIHNNSTDNWTEGNLICLKMNIFPAFVDSINNTGFGDEQNQYYWTGIVRSRTLLNRTTIGSTAYSDVLYGFLEGMTGKFKLTEDGTKQALCVTETDTSCMPISTEGQPPIRDKTTIQPEGSSALGAGIGVSVGVLVVAGGAVVIIVLKRRGKLPNCMNSKKCEKEVLNNGGKSSNEVRLNNSVADHSYFVPEKHTISEDEPVDHYNTPGDPNEVIAEEDNFNAINDTEKPRGNVQGDNSDYDYTTNGAAQSPCNADNVYNKPKLDQHGDYDHVKGQGQLHNITTSNAYDTAAALASKARDAQGNGDYDHVKGLGHKHNITTSNDYNTTAALASKARDGNGDYDHVKGQGKTHYTTAGNDYDTAAATSAAHAKGDESNYNHIPTSKVHARVRD